MGTLYKRGKIWYMCYNYRGKRVQESARTRYRKVAELKLQGIETKIIKGEYFDIVEPHEVIFKDVSEKYLNWSKINKKPSSYERDVLSLKIHLIPYFKGKCLHELTHKMIEEYQIMRANQVENATVNREIQCLKHLLKKAVENGYIKINPSQNIKMLKEPPGSIRWLMLEEEKALLDTCAEHLRPIVIVALHTGLRKSELLNLKWINVNLINRIITLTNTKNNKPHTVPMNQVVYEELLHLNNKRRSGFVFTDEEGRPFRKVDRSFKNALKRAEIKDFRFHDLRHTFASRLAMAGWNMVTIQRLMGHKDLQSTMRYMHLSKGHLQEAVNSLVPNTKSVTNTLQLSFDKNAESLKSLLYSDAPVAQ